MHKLVERIRERYNSHVAKYVEKEILEPLKHTGIGEAVGDPVEKVREELDGWLKPEHTETVVGLVRFLQAMVAPFGRVSVRQINKQKYIIIEKVEQLPTKPTQSKPADKHIKTKCIVCNSGFDFFGANEGDCQTRYRGRSGLVVDSLVVCPECEQKDCLVWDDEKEYFKRGKIPRKQRHLSKFNIKAII